MQCCSLSFRCVGTRGSCFGNNSGTHLNLYTGSPMLWELQMELLFLLLPMDVCSWSCLGTDTAWQLWCGAFVAQLSVGSCWYNRPESKRISLYRSSWWEPVGPIGIGPRQRVSPAGFTRWGEKTPSAQFVQLCGFWFLARLLHEFETTKHMFSNNAKTWWTSHVLGSWAEISSQKSIKMI